jgi:iron complex outermembrane receptor protein
MKKQILILISIFIFTFVNAQSTDFEISGTVSDVETGELLVYTTVFQVGTVNGTTSNIDGKFRLKIEDRTYKKIEFSFIGYETQLITLDFEQTEYDVLLKQVSIEIGMPIIPSRRIYPQPHHENGKLLNRSTPTTILSKKTLERNDGFSFAPVLNQTPGLFMQNGTLNTNRISIRGIGARSPFSTSKIRAYINEIPLTSGDGETTIEDFDLSFFDKIEITKGPGDVTYGSSLGGTILMKTFDLFNNPNHFESKTQFGSYNTVSTTNQLTTNLGNSGWINIRHSLLRSDGYRNNNESDRQNFSLLGKVSGGEVGNFYVLANYTNAKAEIPSSIDSLTFVNNPQAAAANWEAVNGNEDYDKGTFGLSYEKDFYDANWQIASSVFYTFRNNYEVRPFNILDENSDMFGIRAKGTYNKQIKNNPLELVIGTEIFNENYEWQTLENGTENQISDNQENRFYYNAFAQADFKVWNSVIFNAGLNFNNTRYELTDLFNRDSTNQSGNYSFEPTVSPRFGVVIEPTLSEKFGEAVIYINVGHGFSPPTVSETLTPDGQINPNIQPETGWNYEIGSRGFLYELPQTSQTYGIYYDFSFYRMNIENLLVGQNLGNGAFTAINAGKTQHNGFEGLVKYTPFVDRKYLIDLSIAYTFTDYKFTEFTDGNFEYSGNELTGIPSNSIQTFLDFHYNIKENIRIYSNVHYQFIDKMPINDANTIYSESYQLTNAKIGLRWGFEKIFLNFYGGINNIFNEEYASMLAINARGFGGNAPRYYYPGLPRHFYGGFSIKWNF